MGSQRVGHDLTTEQQQQEFGLLWKLKDFFFFFFLATPCVCGILVPQPWIKLMPPALEAES